MGALPRLSSQNTTDRFDVFSVQCMASSGGAKQRWLGDGGAQEDAGDIEAAAGTLEAALEWWRHSMSDAVGDGTRTEQWLMQRLVQVQSPCLHAVQFLGGKSAVEMQV